MNNPILAERVKLYSLYCLPQMTVVDGIPTKIENVWRNKEAEDLYNKLGAMYQEQLEWERKLMSGLVIRNDRDS